MSAVKVISLPYMGKPAEPKLLRTENRTRMQSIPESSEIFDSPEVIFIQKVERLAAILGCAERHAEDIILRRL